MLNASQVADWFINKAKETNKTFSIIHILKLTYISYGWYLENTKKSLFNDKIEAWQVGPVISYVYNKHRKEKKHECGQCLTPFESKPTTYQKDVVDILEGVWLTYGHLNAGYLTNLLTKEDTPWAIALSIGGVYSRIPDSLILLHYKYLRLMRA